MAGETNGNEIGGGSKIIPTLAAATEKLIHYTYLKEFRVEPCPLFKQHQCQQHRPYTCFHWHFANQRRRRPVRRKDGTFNYSPDIYCTKYDENSGICPDGDECPFLHRVAGDVERKYHLRYYKTALCVHSTDGRGQCAKNGPHCAFAHNAGDLRTPIFDVREIQQQNSDSVVNGLLEHKERTSFVVEDPAWQDQEHVLACYKTEPCKKPPRLCRQGYACPYYHNGKDRRRPPGVFKYRSTPCPSAKVGDEWADPDTCDNGDHCQYCHTRTEQQFHPEIYKSTKCNDMLQHGYCPRGPFCAFAHNDVELHCERQIRKPPALVASVSGSPPAGGFLSQQQQKLNDDAEQRAHDISAAALPYPVVSLPEAPLAPAGVTSISPSHLPGGTNTTASYSAVLSKQRLQATAIGAPVKTFSRAPGPATTDVLSNSYPKAPGFERGQFSPTRTWTPDLQSAAASRMRTTSLTMGQLDLGCTLGSNEAVGTPPTPGSLRSNSFSPFARTHEGGHVHASNGLDELNFDELATITEQREDQLLPDTQSILHSTSLYNSQSAPVQIPGSTYTSAFGTSSSPLVGASSSAGGDGPFRMSGSFGKFSVDSVGSGSALQQQLPCSMEESMLLVSELQKAREELQSHRHKLSAWEDGLKQARQACEAWKRDAENNRRLALQAEADRIKATQERDQAVLQLERLRLDMRRLQQLALGQLNNNVASHQPISVEQIYAALQHDQLSPSQGANGPVCGRCGRHVNGSTASMGCPVCSVKASQQNTTTT